MRESANQRAYEYLKQRLTDDRLDEGAFLTEGVIADELGISRTPVREALLRLDAEKLVTLVPGRGAIIPHITERTMREVMEARELIENHAITRMPLPNAPLVTTLRELLEAQKDAEGDPAAFIDRDRRFHQGIIDAAGNRLLSELYSSLRDRQTRMGLRAVLRNDARIPGVVEEHADIADAIAQGDVDAAVAASRAHLRTTLDVLLAQGD